MGNGRSVIAPWRVALRLGRVSNLPTVWSNVLAGTVLAGGLPPMAPVAPLALLVVAVSLFYLAGMFLNDAFDRRIDARERPERPIPAGEVDAAAVFAAGFGMMAAGLAVLAPLGWRALLAGAVLCALILLYDAWHKRNPLSPLLMGLCRARVSGTAGLAVTPAPAPALWLGAAALLAWVVGLTHVARRETLADPGALWPLAFLAAPFAVAAALAGAAPAAWAAWAALAAFAAWTGYALSLVALPGRRDIGGAVAAFLAGIALLDAAMMAAAGSAAGAVAALLAFLLARLLQRYIPAT